LEGTNVNVELVLGENPITGDREAWLKVQSDEVIDLPDALKELTEDQATALEDFCYLDTLGNPTPKNYWIGLPEDETAYRFEDWWMFTEKSTAKNYRVRQQA
jgi:hypothetical protein